MFESVGWAEILVLGILGLFILGPERLPSAAAWVGKSIRKVREFATGARDQLKTELGPEYDELRKPLEDLRQLRNFDPKTMVANHLFGDDTNGGVKPNGHAPTPQPPLPQSPASGTTQASTTQGTAQTGTTQAGTTQAGTAQASTPSPEAPLPPPGAPGPRPPRPPEQDRPSFDPDAT